MGIYTDLKDALSGRPFCVAGEVPGTVAESALLRTLAPSGWSSSQDAASQNPERLVKGFVASANLNLYATRVNEGNPFSTVFHGTISSSNRTTLISGTFRFRRYIRLLVYFWISFACVGVLLMWLRAGLNFSAGDAAGGIRSLAISGVPFAFVAYLLLLVTLGLRRNRSNEQFLMEKLSQAVRST